jgi:flagellar motility protein MotE (MotC chaperone)
MGLYYGHTCPDIDRSITSFKSDIESYLSNMLDDCCPILEGKQKEDFIKDYAEQMYSDFEPNFEDVRKTNEDMRKEADRQIDYAEEKASDAEEEIKDLNARIKELEGQVSELESELDAVT